MKLRTAAGNVKRAATRLYLNRSGDRDARRLQQEGLAADRLPFADIEEAYRDYVSTVSTPGMAASFETSAMLLWLCRSVQARRVLDLGSGFSSWVLRHYSEHDVDDDVEVAVVSVDDAREWLTKTQDFLERYDLGDEGELLAYDDFELTPGSFDVVFYDFAAGAIREEVMPVGFAAARPGGFVLVDDAQHDSHRKHMHRNAKATGSDLWSLRRWTLDDIGRFSMLARKPPAA